MRIIFVLLGFHLVGVGNVMFGRRWYSLRCCHATYEYLQLLRSRNRAWAQPSWWASMISYWILFTFSTSVLTLSWLHFWFNRVLSLLQVNGIVRDRSEVHPILMWTQVHSTATYYVYYNACDTPTIYIFQFRGQYIPFGTQTNRTKNRSECIVWISWGNWSRTQHFCTHRETKVLIVSFPLP